MVHIIWSLYKLYGPYNNYPYQNLNDFLDHMKLQRHIHAMDALRHLLTTAQG